MSHIRRLCAAFALACALTAPVYAGEISCGVMPPPPQEPTVIEFTVTFLQGVLALL